MAFRERLANGLVFHNVQDEGDIERFIAFNHACNNPYEGATCACLLHYHPWTTDDDYWLTEEEKTGKVVSTACLIPWTCQLAGVELRTAMMEMVLTHPDYRRQGLARLQIRRFMQEVEARSFDLSIIWGIPYYYRQFGYAYAIDGNAYEVLPIGRIPDNWTGDCSPFHLRPARLDDIPLLTSLYEQANAPLQVYMAREAKYWRYLLNNAQYNVQILEDEHTGEVAGYVALARSMEEQGSCVLEDGILDATRGLAFLHSIKAEAGGEVRIGWPESGVLVQLARNLGSQTQLGLQWLLRIPDYNRFLRKLTPVFEERLAASMWRGLTMNLDLNLFRGAYRLQFAAGKLVSISPLGFVDTSMGADGGHLCIAPEAFIRLVFGFRGLDELRDAWPDIVVKKEVRGLIDVLFPRMKSYLNTPYHFMESGP